MCLSPTFSLDLSVLLLLRNERRLRESKDSRLLPASLSTTSHLLSCISCTRIVISSSIHTHTYIYVFANFTRGSFYRAKLSILRTLLPRIFVSIECSLRRKPTFLFPFFPLCFFQKPVYMVGGNNDTAHLYWQASFSRLTRIEGNSGGPQIVSQDN